MEGRYLIHPTIKTYLLDLCHYIPSILLDVYIMKFLGSFPSEYLKYFLEISIQI